MISNSRFIVAGPKSCIFIFETPENLQVRTGGSDRLPTIPLAPIWTFQSHIEDFQQGPIFYIRSDPKPMLWIAEGTELFHHFVFSSGTNPVEKHIIFDEQQFTPSPAMGVSRAMWTWEFQGSVAGCMLKLNGSRDRGLFEVPLEGAENMDNYSFDEESGRISLMIKEPFRRVCILVFDSVPANFRAQIA